MHTTKLDDETLRRAMVGRMVPILRFPVAEVLVLSRG
jgi:hypothetical protein